MPMEPTPVRVDTISTSSSKTFPSGVRTSTGNLFLAIVLRGLLGLYRTLGLGRALGLCTLHFCTLLFLFCTLLFLFCLGAARTALADVGHGLVNRALHVEGPLRQLVVLALDDLG